MKRKKDKGFTLVELIVVLVILAILAAILVPALLGYIDRAKEKQYVLNAKSALTATQAEFSSLYGEGSDVVKDGKFVRSAVVAKTADTPDGSAFYVKIQANAEGVDATNPAVSKNHDHYTVKEAIYVESGYYCYFNGSTWTTTEGTPTLTGYTKIYPADTSSNTNSGNDGN